MIYLILTSFKRFTQILLLEEKPEISYQDCSEHSLIVNNCKFSWSLPENHTEDAGDHSPLMENPKIWTLNNINFSIKPSELIIVIGSVGSGKTALFLGILKELCILDGSIAKTWRYRICIRRALDNFRNNQRKYPDGCRL